jgi:hypothetical protein
MTEDAMPDVVEPAVVELVEDQAGDPEDVLVLDEHVLPMWEPTGQASVDAVLDELTALDPDDLASQAAVFDRVHQGLRQVLADLDG